MSEVKNYYYLKLKDNFFDSDEIKILEKMPNGYKYSNILLKLYLKSLRFNGALRLNEYIPYNTDMIAALTGHDVDTVRVAVDIFEQLKLIETLDNGTIYMLNVQSFIGKSSNEADRKRLYRMEIEEEKKQLESGTNVRHLSDERAPEIEIELEIELELEIEKKKKNETEENPPAPYQEVVDLYNEICGSKLPSVKYLSQDRKRAIKISWNRIEGSKDEKLETFKSLFVMASDNAFLTGNNGRRWRADFNWLLKEKSMAKVLENGYAPGAGKKQDSTFNNFEHRPYDGRDGSMTMGELERKLLGWDEESIGDE